MPKSMIVELAVPSGSRQQQFHSWLSKLLAPHRMSVLTCTEPLPLKEQAQQLVQVASTLEAESRATVGDFARAELLSELANDFDLCQRIMERLQACGEADL